MEVKYLLRPGADITLCDFLLGWEPGKSSTSLCHRTCPSHRVFFSITKKKAVTELTMLSNIARPKERGSPGPRLLELQIMTKHTIQNKFITK